jgi:hypothetical protein
MNAIARLIVTRSYFVLFPTIFACLTSHLEVSRITVFCFVEVYDG